jgi:hypothetical protein
MAPLVTSHNVFFRMALGRLDRQRKQKADLTAVPAIREYIEGFQ